MGEKPHRFWFHLDKGKWLPYKPGQEPDKVKIGLPPPPDDFDIEALAEQSRNAIAWAIWSTGPFNPELKWTNVPVQPCPDCDAARDHHHE